MTEAVFEQLDPIIVATIRHKGAHDPRSTDDAWNELILWASPRRMLGRRFDVRAVGMLWDDPRLFAADDRRYDVGVPVDPQDAGEVVQPVFITVTMPGEYLKATHKGSYDSILRTYDLVLGTTMRYENLELAAAPMLEVYRNSPAEVAEDELVTDVYFPVVRL